MAANQRMGMGWTGLGVWMALLGWGVIGADPAQAQDAATDFRNNCVSCHTIGGGRLVGPDLKGVTDRRDRQWLLKYMSDPKAMIDSGDPVAQKLAKESGGVIMPTLPLGKARFEALIDLLESESKLPRSKFAGQVVSDRPLGPADVAAGKNIFMGRQSLTAGGSACYSCHSVEGIGSLGGGALGPDLTKVFERLGGRKGLTAWLGAPATPTMQAAFGTHPLEQGEIESLVAYFQAQAQFAETPKPRQLFLGLGLAGACFALWGLNTLWKKRLGGVRRAMVQKAAIKG